MKKIISWLLICMLFSVCSPAVLAAEQNPLLLRLRTSGGNTVTVLMYHLLSENTKDHSDFCISPQEFEKDIKLMKEKGYTFCTAGELSGYAKSKSTGKKLVAVTFDDGYMSDYKYALPILEKYNAKATFFVFGEAIGTPGYMGEKEIKALSESPCAEIGNHSFAIHSKPIAEVKNLYKSEKNTQQIVSDFLKNKTLLEKITGKQITALSYPNGAYNLQVDSLLKKSGVRITFSTEERYERIYENSKPLGRFNRGKDTDLTAYIQ